MKGRRVSQALGQREVRIVSNVYGYAGYGGAASSPPNKVNFGWIGESWRIFGQAAGIWIVAMLLYGIVSSVVQGVFASVFANPGYVPAPSPFGRRFDFGVHYGTNSNLTPLGQALSLLFSLVFGAFQNASLYRLAVWQVRGAAASFGDMFGGGPYFGAMLLFNLLFALAAVAGIIAVCVGLFVVMAFLLPAPALIADGESATGAFSRSIEAMKQDWLSASGFVFVYVLLMLASLIPCGFGLFVTIPMLHVISALSYRDMVGMPGLPDASQSGYGAAQPGVWPPPPDAPPPPGNWPPPAA